MEKLPAVRVGLSACAVALGCYPSAAAQLVTRVTDLERSSGLQPSAGAMNGGLSADGRWLAQLGCCNALLRDLATGESINASPPLPGFGEFGYGLGPSISADGRIVSYWSGFGGLVPNDTNSAEDVFVFDRSTGVVRRISEGPGGVQSPTDVLSQYPRTSGDGSTVVYWSESRTLGPTDLNFTPDLYAYDLATGVNELVSVGSNGLQGTCPSGCTVSEEFSVSFDGRFVAFVTNASFDPLDTVGWDDVYVRDRLFGQTERVSLTTTGAQITGWSWSPAISGDGRFVAFVSDAPNMIPGSTGYSRDVFVRDRVAGTTELLTINALGVAGGGVDWAPRISSRGRFVAFNSIANGFVASDTDNRPDIFLRDRVFGATWRVTLGLGGQTIFGSTHGEIAAVDDRGRVLFNSGSPELALGLGPFDPTQPLGVTAAHLYHPRYRSDAILGYCTPKTNSLGCTPRIANIGFPSLSDNASLFVKALRVRSHQSGMLLWSRTQQSTPFGGGTLCVGPPIGRTRIQDSGGLAPNDCSGQYSFHFSPQFFRDESLDIGDAFYAQFYGRDPGFAHPANITLTDAASFIVLP